MNETSIPQPLSLLIIGGFTLLREALLYLLDASASIDKSWQVQDALEARKLIEAHQPDVTLFDWEENMDPLDIDAIASLEQNPKLLVLTSSTNPETHRHLIRLGAMGIVTKHENGQILSKALHCVASGQLWVNRSTAASVFRLLRDDAQRKANKQLVHLELTVREREIATAIVKGLKTAQIAEHFHISEKTVRNHIASIYEKLDISTRLELVMNAAKHGLE